MVTEYLISLGYNQTSAENISFCLYMIGMIVLLSLAYYLGRMDAKYKQELKEKAEARRARAQAQHPPRWSKDEFKKLIEAATIDKEDWLRGMQDTEKNQG